MCQLRTVFLLLLTFISFTINGQEYYPIQNFLPDNYHGESQNWDISQSPNQNIYIANNKGLLEFNGAGWKLYPSPNHSIMRSVQVQNDRIYTGCYMEFGYWKKDEFSTLIYTSLSEKIENDLVEDEQFWKIKCFDQWVLFQSLQRLYIYNSQTEDFQFITSKTNIPKVFEVGNDIYFQKIDEGLIKLKNGNSIVVSDFPVFKKNIIINVFPFQNNLLIQTQDKGFFILRKDKVSKWQTKDASKINTLSVYSSIQLHDGSFVLGTISEGLYFLSSEGEITMQIDKKSGLQNNTILSLFEDTDNNIWLGLDNGISVINYDSPFRVYTDTKGIFGSVYATEYYQGYIYLGTNQGLFYRLVDSKDDFKIIEGTKGQVWSLKNIDETLFCGHNSGTFIIKDKKAILISDILGTWDIKPILNNENLLIQGNYEGLHILEKVNGNWQYRNKLDGFDISSRYFELVQNNQILVSHEYRGVYNLELSSDLKRVIKYNIEESAPISINSGLNKYNGKLLYFGSSGIYEFNQQGNQFQKELLMSKLILGDDLYLSGKLIEEKNERLWAFTEENIIVLFPGNIDKDPQILKVPLPLSLRENRVGYENLLNVGNEKYILGTGNGYILFDLDKIDDKECNIHINSIEKNNLNENTVHISLLENNYYLKAKENNLSFSYSVPVYDRFTEVKYQYKLEGIYDEWSHWTKESKVSFANLPSGEYSFYVRAKVGDRLTANTAAFSFSIAEPWFLTTRMKIVYVIVFLLILAIISNMFRRNYNRQKNKILEKKKKELELLQLENEQERMKLRNENLNSELEAINKELTSTTMAIVKKNELLNTIKSTLSQEKENQYVQSAITFIDENLEIQTDWKSFKEAFDNTDRDFLKKLKELHPSITPNDLKLCVYLRLNLSSKEIAPMLNISAQSVEIKRFRLRKKMDLGHEQNLTEYILNI